MIFYTIHNAVHTNHKRFLFDTNILIDSSPAKSKCCPMQSVAYTIVKQQQQPATTITNTSYMTSDKMSIDDKTFAVSYDAYLKNRNTK